MSDTQSFEQFMRNYQNMVFSHSIRLLGNATEAEDISQEVFLKAYQYYHEIGQSPTAGGWLKTVTTNLCLNHLSRYRSRWRFFSEMHDEDNEQDYAADLPAPDTQEQDISLAEQKQLLEKALQKLPPAQRVPLVLFHFEGMRYEDIATRLGVSLSKVKTDIFRARENLRKKLRWQLSDEPSSGSSCSPSQGSACGASPAQLCLSPLPGLTSLG